MGDAEIKKLRTALAALGEAYAALEAEHEEPRSHRILRFSWGKAGIEEAEEAEQWTDFPLCLDPASPEFFEAIPVPNAFNVNLWIQWKQDDLDAELPE